MRRRVLLATCALGGSRTAWADVSGFYVGFDQMGAALVHLVQVASGNVTGRYEHLSTDQRGTVSVIEAELQGVASGRDLVLTLRPQGILTSSVAISATIGGRTLTLRRPASAQDPGPINLVLERAEPAAYEQAVARVRAHAAVLAELDRARQAAASISRRMGALGDEIARYRDTIDRAFAAFPGDQRRLEALTAQMERLLARLRQLPRGNAPGAYGDRAEISSTIRGHAAEGRGMAAEIMGRSAGVPALTASIERGLQELQTACTAFAAQPVQAEGAEAEGARSACATLPSVKAEFQRKRQEARDAWSRVLQGFEAQERRQERLVQEAMALTY